MTHTYQIDGLTCGGCVANAKSALLSLGDVTEATVQLAPPQATITMQRHIPTATLQQSLDKAGRYTITEWGGNVDQPGDHKGSTGPTDAESTWLATYRPLLLIGAYSVGSTLLVEAASGGFDPHRWMRNFMVLFFLVFSFFKLLDLRGFADSYASYDLVAMRWRPWGFVYPFIELALGIAYFVRFQPLLTNGFTFVIMTISLAGVLLAVTRRRKIQCACLGTVFNLPMSTVTIVEDVLMIGMSAAMVSTLV